MKIKLNKKLKFKTFKINIFMSIKCQFCLKEFVNKSNLLKHQHKTQKCIKLQKQIDENKIQIKLIETNDRLKRKSEESQNLENKLEILQNELQLVKESKQFLHDENQQLKELNIKLQTENTLLQKHQDIVFKLAQEPKNKTTNIIQNLSVYDGNLIKDRFTSVINDVEASDLYDGQKSISKLVAPCLKNDDGTIMIQCADYSRNIFITKDNKGNIIKDINCRNLCDLIQPIATLKANQLFYNDFRERSKYHEIKRLQTVIKDSIDFSYMLYM